MHMNEHICPYSTDGTSFTAPVLDPKQGVFFKFCGFFLIAQMSMHVCFWLHFAVSMCATLLQVWIHLNPNLIIPEEEVSELNRSDYWSSCILPGGRISVQMSSQIQELD